jgi:hypothetical protein
MSSDLLISRPVSTISPVISSIAGTIRQYIQSILPENYLKDFFITTEIPLYRYLNQDKFRKLTYNEISIRSLPLLSIKVETIADESEFASGTAYWTSNQYLRDPMSLNRLIIDDVALRYVGFEDNRIKINFQISIILETDLKATELMMYLTQTLPINRLVYINGVNVSSEIPKDLLRAIWTSLRLSSTPSSENYDFFRRYLLSVTGGNVEQIINTATGRIGYSYNYLNNILVKFDSPPTLNVTREGNVVETAQIDFSLQVDLKIPIAYAYKQEEVYTSIGDIPPDNLGLENSDAYFSMMVRTRPPQNITVDTHNLQLVYFSSFVTDKKNLEDIRLKDVTDIYQSCDPRIVKYINYLLTKDNPSEFVQIKLWLGDSEINLLDYKFDFELGLLELEYPILQYQQKYHFGIYLEISEINQAIPITDQYNLNYNSPFIQM